MIRPNREAYEAISNAEALARRSRHAFLSVEHLFHALLATQSVSSLLVMLNADTETIEKETLEALGLMDFDTEGGDRIDATPALTRTFGNAQARAAQREDEDAETTPLDLLLAITAERNCTPSIILENHGISHDIIASISASAEEADEVTPAGERGRPARRKPRSADFLIDLNERAVAGRIDPVIGRDSEIESVAQTLCRRKKNNPVLVGDPGVGKTAIAEGLALAIIEGSAPEALHGMTVYQLDVGALMAGTRYRGDLEERLKVAIAFLAERKNAILFVDEIHMLVGGGSGFDISNILKPALARGELKCIGATSFAEYRQIFERDAAMARRFQKIDVMEPSPKDALSILKAAAPLYAGHHNVTYTDEALEAAVNLSVRHIHDRRLPDKALDIIDEAGARARILRSDDKIGEVQIESVVARMARIPETEFAAGSNDNLLELEARMRASIFEQDDAIRIVSDAVITARAGLRDDNKPVGSFLFAGPTGVGKTELARQLATELGMNLLRFDMSEYMEPHSVAKLIGSPPGYVGHDKGGLLTEALTKTPHAVLLLDEFEKAHPSIQNLLLQAMDARRLTDSHGREVSLQNAILVMTTNAGADAGQKETIGFHHGRNQVSDAAMGEIERQWSPEFRNRLDAIVIFKPLSQTGAMRIARKFASNLQEKVAAQNAALVFTDEAIAFIAEGGFDAKMGARPMERFIDKHVKRPLARLLLSRNRDESGAMRVVVKNGAIDIERLPATARRQA